MRRLPGFASRLLDDLGQSHLAGDLAEQLASQPRSILWVSWQVSAAILSGAYRQVKANKWLTVRAVLLACVLFYVSTIALTVFARPLERNFITRYVPIAATTYMAPAYQWVEGVPVLRPERYPMSWQKAFIEPMLGYTSYFLAAMLVGGVISMRYARIRFTAVCVVCAVITVTLLPSLWPKVPNGPVVPVNFGYQLRFLFPLTTLLGIPFGGTLGRMVRR